MCKHLDRLSGFHLWHWPLLVEVIPNDITGRRDPHRVLNDSPAEEIFEPPERANIRLLFTQVQ